MNVYFSDENKGSLPLQPVDTGHTLSLLNDKGDLYSLDFDIHVQHISLLSIPLAGFYMGKRGNSPLTKASSSNLIICN